MKRGRPKKIQEKKPKEKIQKVEKKNIQIDSQIIESLVLQGDISKMSAEQKVNYYNWLCKSLGLNPATQPFQIIKFQGKETLYAKKDATEQLRKIYGVSIIEIQDKLENEIFRVNVKIMDKKGRTDSGLGVVSLKGLSGDALCNAMMKAETKAKRRATLSICGLGILDESETDTIGSYEIIDLPKEKQLFLNMKSDIKITDAKVIPEPEKKLSPASLKMPAVSNEEGSSTDKEIKVDAATKKRLIEIADESNEADRKTLLQLSTLKTLDKEHLILIEKIKEKNVKHKEELTKQFEQMKINLLAKCLKNESWAMKIKEQIGINMVFPINEDFEMAIGKLTIKDFDLVKTLLLQSTGGE